jgi:hypothetical protein
MVNLNFGTTATVQTMSKRYFETLPLLPPYPALSFLYIRIQKITGYPE